MLIQIPWSSFIGDLKIQWNPWNPWNTPRVHWCDFRWWCGVLGRSGGGHPRHVFLGRAERRAVHQWSSTGNSGDGDAVPGTWIFPGIFQGIDTVISWVYFMYFFLNVCVFGFKWGCKSTKICPGKLRDYIWWKIYQFTNVTNLPITKMWFLIFSMGHPLGYFHRVIFLGAPSAPPSWSKRPLLTISSSHHIKHMYAGWKSAWMGMSWRRYPQCWLNH